MVAILDRFKRKRKALGRPEAAEEPKAAGSAPAAAARDRPKGERRIVGVIVAPHLTEKSSAGNARGWYTFRVRDTADKILIRRAVEDRYGVTVERVRIVHQPAKKVRLGRITGEAPGFKKAMVKVRAGQSIEFT